MFDPFFGMVSQEILDAFYKFSGSLVLFVMIIGISYWRKMKMERFFVIAAIRGFVQLLILASLLFYIFQLEGLLPLYGILLIMITFGARTAVSRLKEINGVFRIEMIALTISVFFVMTLMSLLNVLPTNDPAFWIPIGGMVTGNSMNISYLALNNLNNEIKNRKGQIIAGLSLGASPGYVLNTLRIIPEALSTSITPNTNNLKTLGLVFIPGLMTGLLIGGLHPIAAAFLQVMIFFIILGGGVLASLIATWLIIGNLFDMENQTLLEYN